MILFPVSESFFKSAIGKTLFGEEVSGDHQAHQEYIKGLLFRTLLIVFCFAVSLTGIHIIDFISLSGSLFNSLICFVFPVGRLDQDRFLHQLLRAERRARPKAQE